MYNLRRIATNRWIATAVLGVFILWAGMVVCMLPVDHGATLGVHEQSDCVQVGDESVPTYCETDGRTVVLSDLVKFVAIDNYLALRFAEYVPFLSAAPVPVNSSPIRHVSLFLFLCTFLK